MVGRSPNKNAIGARLVASGSEFKRAYNISCGTSYLSQSEPGLRINKAILEGVDELKVFWPDGTESSVEKPKPNKEITIRQSQL